MTAVTSARTPGGDYLSAAANVVDRVPTADDPRLSGLSTARTAGPAAAADRSRAVSPSETTLRSWPLLVLAAPAAAEVWSGWVGIAQKTGFGLVSPLPGIWPSLHLDTSITLPVGVEAYAAYALRAWLTSEPWVSHRTRRFAKWSAISSFGLGMAGQVAYHLLAQAGAGSAMGHHHHRVLPACLPVLVLAMGTTLAHMLRADAATGDAADAGTSGPAIHSRDHSYLYRGRLLQAATETAARIVSVPSPRTAEIMRRPPASTSAPSTSTSGSATRPAWPPATVSSGFWEQTATARPLRSSPGMSRHWRSGSGLASRRP